MRLHVCAAMAVFALQVGQAPAHNTHPDAQWFPTAAFGLFPHWDPASVTGINIGWSDIPGRKIAAHKETFTPADVERIRELQPHSARGHAAARRLGCALRVRSRHADHQTPCVETHEPA